MLIRFKTFFAALSLLVGLVALTPPSAQAAGLPGGLSVPEFLQELSPENLLEPPDFSQLVTGLEMLPINTAQWLARHLPATMPMVGLGAGFDQEDGFGLGIGIIPLRLGFFNQFDRVFADFKNEEEPGTGGPFEYIADMAPALMAWPQFGLTVGGSMHFFEVAAEVHVLPEMDLTLVEGVEFSAETFSAAGSIRFRINDPWNFVPAFIIGCSGGYYTGSMMFSARMADNLPLTENLSVEVLGETLAIEGSYAFHSVTNVTWDLYMVSPEFRMAWAIGPFKPFVGFGVGFTFGEIIGEADVSTFVELTAVGGEIIGDEGMNPTQSEKSSVDVYKPAPYVVHPHVGFDLDLGLFAMTAQVELAVMFDSEEEFSNANAGAIMSDATSKGATTSVAIVSTIGARIQF
ncbi:MAG: hypothetical protein ACPGU1_15355 [Myxococcota bacterium]